MKKLAFYFLIAAFIGLIFLPSIAVVTFLAFVVPAEQPKLYLEIVDDEGRAVQLATVTLVQGHGSSAYAQSTHPNRLGYAIFSIRSGGEYRVIVKRTGMGKSTHEIYLRYFGTSYRKIQLKRHPMLLPKGVADDERLLRVFKSRPTGRLFLFS